MTRTTFENQPHYATSVGGTEVFDTRFLNGQLAVPQNQQAYEFTAEQPVLPIFPEKKSYDLPSRIGDRGYVHGVTALRYTGRDGEDYSGGIELLEVIIPRERTVAVMRSYLGSHDGGMPAPGTSWVCEFEDVSAALDFWDRHWNKSFRKETLEADIDKFVDVQGFENEQDAGIHSYEVGLLKPWFQQRTTDVVFGGKFSSDGSRAVKVKESDTPAEEFKPGFVYKIPETEWYSTKAKGYRIATCLASFRRMSSAGLMWNRNRDKREETLVQWDDGNLAMYLIGRDELAPTPLLAKDIRTGKGAGARQRQPA